MNRTFQITAMRPRLAPRTRSPKPPSLDVTSPEIRTCDICAPSQQNLALRCWIWPGVCCHWQPYFRKDLRVTLVNSPLVSSLHVAAVSIQFLPGHRRLNVSETFCLCLRRAFLQRTCPVNTVTLRAWRAGGPLAPPGYSCSPSSSTSTGAMEGPELR